MEAQRKAVETIPVDEGLIRSTTQALVDAQTEMAIQQARLLARNIRSLLQNKPLKPFVFETLNHGAL